ncbi:uncharacterized protein LOC116932565 [Daphnia magna]|uniref:Uncharacterized protein n=1 Tax=Daphnia magna TaxID=35525 RepID=A0ABQ9YRH1_9CRUS|nr:uncharacterized protein LOC116932565 [Daphnia magna]KAK4003217.1 hypothetical protein OUZ56_004997 [Daphnia magna]
MVGGRGRASGKSQRGRQLVSRRSEAGFATESYQAIPANPAPVLQRIVDELPEDPHQQKVLNEEAEVEEMEGLNQTADNREEEEDRHPPVKEQAPPVEPIALITVQSWKVAWQHKFQYSLRHFVGLAKPNKI